MSVKIRENNSKKFHKKVFIIIVSIIIFSAPFLASFIADKYAVSKVNGILSQLENDCYEIYDNANYSISSKTFTLTNFSVICLEEEAAKFDSVKITDVTIKNNVSTALTANFNNAVINADAKIFGSIAGIASKIGLDAINNRGQISYIIDDNKGVISFTVNADNLGVIAGVINIKNHNLINETNLRKIISQLFDSKNLTMTVTFKDNGLLDNAMEKYALALGVSSSFKARDRALNGLEKRIQIESKNQHQTAQKLAEIYKFIQNPKEITVTVTEDDNISLKDIYSSLNYSGWRHFIASIGNFKPAIKSE